MLDAYTVPVGKVLLAKWFWIRNTTALAATLQIYHFRGVAIQPIDSRSIGINANLFLAQEMVLEAGEKLQLQSGTSLSLIVAVYGAELTA